MKKTSKVKSGGVKSGGVNSPTPSLTHSPTPSLTHSPTLSLPQALTTQYKTVVAATGQMLREAVKFGAMLMELETIVGKSHGGRDTEGDGIKGWLAEHCPEINYSTAIVYKNLAAKSATLIGGMGLQVVAALQGGEKVTKTDGEVIDVPAEIIEKRDALFAECDSRRKLEQAYFAFMSETGNGERGTGNGKRGTGAPLPKLSQRDAAKSIWNIFMQKATNRSLKDAIPLLGEKETQTCHDDLRDLVNMLKDHLNEF